MIKAIIFDFDGVILESADIKTETFRELFKEYPQKTKAIVRYHLFNAGISRYVKFRHISEHILKKELSKSEEIELGKRFSQIALEKVLAAPFVAGAREFLDRGKSRYQFFIASGTPEEELHNIVRARGLQGYFKEIHGSPKEKSDIIEGIIRRSQFKKKEVVYIGDAESDRIAAKQSGVVFVERKADLNLSNKNSFRVIKDLSAFEGALKKIDEQDS